MLYQLQDGRTIEISLNEFLSASDEELNNLNSTNYGMEINNPYYGSIITKPGRATMDDDEFVDYDIQDIPVEDKINDQDYTPDE